LSIDAITGAFAGHGKRAALMPYLMGGFPTTDVSREIGLAYADGGADLVELGIPFSDPLADGQVVAAAGTKALRAGATVSGVLEVCSAIAERIPVVIMCYTNQVLARGAEDFTRRLADAGASGLIVPDLPMEEAPAILAACDAADVALVPLVAPTTPESRLKEIGARARGFVYTVTVTGTTGERASLADRFESIVANAKAATDVPVAVGFGITTPEHARQAADAGADGVIVGSRLVRAVAEASDPASEVREVVAGLNAGLAL
jgi:tryptophan synthase alpha chain